MHPKPFTIPVSSPDLSDLERRYLLEAFDSGWISSTGSFVDRFEREFAEFVGVAHAISCVNGTAALHLALLALEIGPGDEVIVPSLTYVATANAVRYVGAEPVFADCNPNTWNVDPQSVKRLMTDRTRAIIPVHLFGNPAEMDELSALARERGVHVVEDASEAHGARFGGRPVGGLGDAATFSFYANKVLATGEGGMVCTSDEGVAQRLRTIRGQGADATRQYWFECVGYNYRMTNPTCAIGLAQLYRFDEIRTKREMVGRWYDAAFRRADLPVAHQTVTPDSDPILWMKGVFLTNDASTNRDQVREMLREEGIETRPFFTAVHTLPMYRECTSDALCQVSGSLGRRGIMLPTHTKLTESDVDRIVESLAAALRVSVAI